MTEVETLAHQKAASSFIPDVTFVIDIGGQDMKCLKVENGLITSVALNEACSSGCGAFLESFSKQLGLTLPEFVQAALRSEHPVDLGSRCTVFMNSKVREAQRDGASSEDIAAGLCISVVRNALEKVLRISSPEDLGDKVVVQGGTFLNDGVLRAFEKYTGLQVIRPQLSGLMGALRCCASGPRANKRTDVGVGTFGRTVRHLRHRQARVSLPRLLKQLRPHLASLCVRQQICERQSMRIRSEESRKRQEKA